MRVTLDKVTAGALFGYPVDPAAAGAQIIATLRDVSLDLEGPGLVALTGSSGAGKSTLLALIAGALPPAAGQVLWNGVDARLCDRRSTVGALVCSTHRTWPADAPDWPPLLLADDLTTPSVPDEIRRRIYPLLVDAATRSLVVASTHDLRIVAMATCVVHVDSGTVVRS